jgi:hypothetical protein
MEARTDVKQVRAVVSLAVTDWGPASLRREQVKDQGVCQILEEI